MVFYLVYCYYSGSLFRATQFFLFSRKNWIYNELFLSLMKRGEILALCTSNPEVIATYIESLESQIKQLSEKLQVLESRLNQNSRNSSKPPSTDFFVKGKSNPKSLRKKSEKNPGGQEGHPGTTLKMVDNPD